MIIPTAESREKIYQEKAGMIRAEPPSLMERPGQQPYRDEVTRERFDVLRNRFVRRRFALAGLLPLPAGRGARGEPELPRGAPRREERRAPRRAPRREERSRGALRTGANPGAVRTIPICKV